MTDIQPVYSSKVMTACSYLRLDCEALWLGV